MKKIIILFTISTLIITACKKDPESVSTIVNVTYPVITLNGEAVVSTNVGTGQYVDPGATGTDELTGATSTLSPVLNNVDLSKPGFYSVKYTMKNANGFITNTTRLVLVTPIDSSVDLSGVYFRTANNVTANVVKKGTGLYTIDNVGGVPLAEYMYEVYFGQTSDTTVEIPTQPNALGGDISSENGILSVSPADTTISWKVIGAGYATNQRTFSHQ
jgi:hypothetical protein